MHLKYAAVAIIALGTVLACQAGIPQDDTSHQESHLPAPDRAQVLIVGEEAPSGLTDPEAVSAYRQGYSHMKDSA